MARYTTRDIEEIIASSDLAENKKAGYARDSKNPDVWKRAGIQPRQTGAGQTGSASSSANVKTASGNTSDSQMLSNIRKYTKKGYKNLNDSERAEMDSIMDAVSQSTSDAINNYSGEWDFSKAVLPGGTEFSGDDYDAYMKYWTDRSNGRSAGNSGKTHLADEAFVKSALYKFPGAKQFARFWEEHIDPMLGTNLVDSDALAEEMAQIQEDQKVASTAGALGGNLAGYYLGAKFAEAIPVLGGAAGQAATPQSQAGESRITAQSPSRKRIASRSSPRMSARKPLPLRSSSAPNRLTSGNPMPQPASNKIKNAESGSYQLPCIDIINSCSVFISAPCSRTDATQAGCRPAADSASDKEIPEA